MSYIDIMQNNQNNFISNEILATSMKSERKKAQSVSHKTPFTLGSLQKEILQHSYGEWM